MITPSPSRLMVLLFTDLAGSTELKSRLGAVAYAPLAARHDELFRSVMARFPEAEILKDLGDGFMARFDTASQAVQAALLFQHAMATEPWKPGPPLRTRIGLHLGEVSDIGADVTGKPKIVGLAADLAARVMSLALPGQILQTRAAFDDARQYVREHPADGASSPTSASPHLVIRWIAHGPYMFKGTDEPLEVYEVGTEGESPLSAPPDNEKARRAVRIDEEETLGWRPAIGLEVPGRPNWHLERELGVGGFGEVWLGSHNRTHEHRVFKFCFDINRLRSFRRELTLFRLLRETLGERADIARLFEVQLDKAPYYLESEFSEPGNLSDWADAQGGLSSISLARRLEIVRRVAEAVHAAHSVGVLHKDIKPSNILMYKYENGEFRPRICDFGIGILTDRSKLEGRNITVAGFTVTQLTDNSSSRTGTQMYAPPENMLSQPFTVQGDVYSLGIVLFQMVVGDLQRPLTQGWEFAVADPLLREDIAACVNGDPALRLTSAKELADRLATLSKRRHIARKLRLLKIGASAAVVALILLGIASLLLIRERSLRDLAEDASLKADSMRKMFAIERDNAIEAEDFAKNQRELAVVEGKKSAAVTDFFQMMLESIDPAIAKGKEVTVKEVLDRASEGIGKQLKDQPDVQAAVRYTMGRMYFALSDHAKAEEHFRWSFDQRAKALGPDDPQTLRTGDELGATLVYMARLDDAEAVLQATFERQERTLGADHEDTLTTLGHLCWVYQDRGDLDKAAALHRQAIEAKERTLGPDHRQTLDAMSTLADVLENAGKLDESVALSTDVVERATKAFGDDDVLTISAMSIRASALGLQGKFEEAERIQRDIVTRKTRIYGPDHEQTWVTKNDLALTLKDMGKPEEGAAILHELLMSALASIGADHPKTLTYRGNLARAEHELKHLDEAEKLMRENYDACVRIHGADAKDTLFEQNNLALLLLDIGRAIDAEPMFIGVVSGFEKAFATDHWLIPAARLNLAECLRELKRFEESEKMGLAAYEGLKQTLGPDHPRVSGAADNIADLYRDWGKPGEEQRWRPQKSQPAATQPS